MKISEGCDPVGYIDRHGNLWTIDQYNQMGGDPRKEWLKPLYTRPGITAAAPSPIALEAAGEIERLRDRVKELELEAEDLGYQLMDANDRD